AGASGPDIWRARAAPASGLAALFDGDAAADFTTLAAGWAATGRLDRLARAFVMGAPLDWTALPVDPAARRIALPGYAFQREHLSVVPKSGWQHTLSVQAQQTPLIGAPDATAAGDGTAWTLDLSPEAPLLAGHVVEGCPVLPGAGFLAAAAEAAGHLEPVNEITLADMVWLARVEVRAPRRMTLRAATDFALSDAETGLPFATARPGTAAPPPPPADLAAAGALLPEAVAAEALYAAFAAAGLAYSGAYRGVKSVRHDASRAIGLLDVSGAPAEVRAAALIDAAFQTLSVFRSDAGGVVLPACLDLYRQFGALPARGRVEAVRTGPARFDLTLYGEDGTCRALFEGLVLRAPPAGFVHVPEWQPAPADLPEGRAGERVLIICPRTARDFGAEIARLHGGAPISWADPDAEDFLARLDRLETQDRIYHLGALAQPAGDDPAEALALAERAGLMALYRVARTLAAGDAAPRLITVTDRLHAPGGKPWGALVPAFLRSVAHELPALACRSLDVDLSERAHWPQIARAIVREASAGPGGPVELRLSLSGREALRLVPVRLAPPRAPALEPGEACAILGGAGGIGLALAERLVEDGARAALFGRRAEEALPDDVRARLAASGGRILYVQADITRAAALGAGLATGAARLGVGGFAGMVHAAMVLNDRALAAMSEQDIAAVLAPKTRGLLALRECLAGQAPRFVLLLSSAQSLIGAPGQANYAAASGFMAAYAGHWAEKVPYRVQVLDMGFWGETGRVATPYYRQTLGAQGIGAIGTREGIDTILAALASPHPRLVPLKATAELMAALHLKPVPARAGDSPAALPSLLGDLMGDDETADAPGLWETVP
ncbi:SDR family NAD(P)-dependent oxidoreductase, partial [Xanthobacteraceae bacterium A53D]